MSATALLALAEVVFVFGGVLLFGWWQLRSISKDQARSALARQTESRVMLPVDGAADGPVDDPADPRAVGRAADGAEGGAGGKPVNLRGPPP